MLANTVFTNKLFLPKVKSGAGVGWCCGSVLLWELRTSQLWFSSVTMEIPECREWCGAACITVYLCVYIWPALVGGRACRPIFGRYCVGGRACCVNNGLPKIPPNHQFKSIFHLHTYTYAYSESSLGPRREACMVSPKVWMNAFAGECECRILVHESHRDESFKFWIKMQVHLWGKD